MTCHLSGTERRDAHSAVTRALSPSHRSDQQQQQVGDHFCREAHQIELQPESPSKQMMCSSSTQPMRRHHSTSRPSTTSPPPFSCESSRVSRNSLKMLLPRTLLARNIPPPPGSPDGIRRPSRPFIAKSRRCPVALSPLVLMLSLLLPNTLVPLPSKSSFFLSSVLLSAVSPLLLSLSLIYLLNGTLKRRVIVLSPTTVVRPPGYLH